MVLYFYHTVFCLFYYWYVDNFGGDAIGYYKSASIGDFDLNFGTDAVSVIVYFLYHIFSLSIISIFLVFNIFGAVGLILFAQCLQVALQGNQSCLSKISWIVLLLPSISFWSSAIGKDSLSFLAITLAIWAALELKKRLLTMAVAIAIMLIIRPHMAAMMMMALAFSMVVDNKISLRRRMFFGAVVLSISSVLVPFALNYAGLYGGLSLMGLNEYVKIRQNHNLEGDGGIDISGMTLPEQLFAYMFRPTLLEGDSVFFLAAGMDNLILLCLFLVGIYHILRGKKSHLGESRVFMWTYALMAWLVLAMTTANMGIALRQKWMFAPCLIFLFISVIASKKLPHLPTSKLSFDDRIDKG